MEIEVDLENLRAWKSLVDAWPELIGQGQAVADAARRDGVYFRMLGRQYKPSEVGIVGDNYRETITCSGLQSRVRAVCDLLERHLPGPPGTVRLYAPEAVTPFARLMSELFPGFVGSEYLADAPASVRAALSGVRHEDLAALSFADAIFDAVMVNDVFEHVPDLRTSLSELARVLKPGGVLLSTQPFACMDEIGQVRARMVDGKIEHLFPPQYHADPVNAGAGTLVFQIPGWDLLSWCRDAGFRLAHMIYVVSTRRGIPGVHVLRAIR
jgi:hypothetical protein